MKKYLLLFILLGSLITQVHSQRKDLQKAVKKGKHSGNEYKAYFKKSYTLGSIEEWIKSNGYVFVSYIREKKGIVGVRFMTAADYEASLDKYGWEWGQRNKDILSKSNGEGAKYVVWGRGVWTPHTVKSKEDLESSWFSADVRVYKGMLKNGELYGRGKLYDTE